MPKAKNLKYCRKKADMTQKELAEALGVTLQTIQSWESKKTAMPVPSTKRVANYFGLSFADFCDKDLEQVDLGAANNGIKLSSQEIRNLLRFRELPDETKDIIRYIIKVTHSPHKKKGEQS